MVLNVVGSNPTGHPKKKPDGFFFLWPWDENPGSPSTKSPERKRRNPTGHPKKKPNGFFFCGHGMSIFLIFVVI